MRRAMVPVICVVGLLAGAVLGAGGAGVAGEDVASAAGEDVASVADADVVSAAGTDIASVADATDARHGGTIEGVVTDGSGAPVEGAYVIVQPAGEDLLAEYTDGDQAIRESLLKVAQSDPEAAAVVRTDGDGSYRISVPADDYRVVAVTDGSDGGVSRLRSVEVRSHQVYTVDLTVDADRVLAVEGGDAGPVAPGETATVTVRVENTDDEPVRSLSIAVESMPEGWELVDWSGADAADADARRFTFERVAPGETATLTLRLSVPSDADRGGHAVRLSATSETHFVETLDPSRVTVRRADATPTTRVTGGEGDTGTPRITGDLSPTGDEAIPVAGPGFGAVVALAALAAALVVLTRRR